MAQSAARISARFDGRHRIERAARSADHHAARVAMVEQYKLAMGCTDCGYSEYPEALDFDHVRGIKSANVNYLTTSASVDRIWAEIEKCEVVCANCHRHRTRERQREVRAARQRNAAQLTLDAYSVELV